MSTTSFNAVIDVGRIDVDASALLDDLAEYHTVLAGTPRGTVEVVMTLPAESLRQAASTALALIAAAGHEPRTILVMTTDDFDIRNGLDPVPEDISVAQAAELLGVTPSAVRQRLAAGTLPGRRVGRDWRLPRADIEALRR